MTVGSRPAALVAALAAALVGGCATTTPAPPALPFTPRASWTEGGTATPEATRGDWWLQLGDPLLADLIAEALRANPSLDAAVARLEAALAGARVAGAALRPQIDAALDGARRRQNFIGLPIPGAAGRVLSNTSTSFGLGAAVAWEADLWSRLGAGRSAALAQAGAAEAELEAVRLSLTGQVARAWYGWLEARQQVELAAETLDNRRRTREQIELRYRRGLRPALDLRLALTAEADSEAQEVQRRQAVEAAARRLEVLLARYPAGDSVVPAASPLADLLGAVPMAQPAELVARRPDLVAAERRLAAAGFDVAAARAALYPRLRLTGSVGRSSTDLADLLDQDFSIWGLAAGLVQPLIQGGRLRAAADAVEARRREVAASYLSAALTAFAEVESALAAETFHRDRIGALERAAVQSRAARELAEERYRAGLEGYLTVLEAQRRATSIESQVLRAHRERLDNRIDLHLALGGDYSTRADEASAAGAGP